MQLPAHLERIQKECGSILAA